ncbi:MarR family transcriptional regulator [Burkholderia ubonensis]|uniref:MarR family transcriptional regulator n=1 Tax=Burkholderia ubonensis TaxID=101571 RepID=UPI000A47406C|nr:helix-turn-helix domain-containing protein [Burkholderia ubonensis]
MKTLTVAAICQLKDLSVQTVEKALASLQEKGLVTGFVPGNVQAEITLTDAAAKYFS